MPARGWWRFARWLSVVYALLLVPAALLALGLLVLARRQDMAEWMAHDRGVVELAQRTLRTATSTASGDAAFVAADVGAALAARTPAELDRAAVLFERLARTRRVYAKLRLIDAAGREVLRVDHRDGRVWRVPDAELQDKGERYFVRALAALPAGTTYVSGLDANVEHGALEIPIRPMFRIGVPVFGADGARKGSLLINVEGDALIERLRDDAAKAHGELRLVDANGRVVLGPTGAGSWGFLDPRQAPQLLAAASRGGWRAPAGESAGQIRSGDALAVFTTFDPDAANPAARGDGRLHIVALQRPPGLATLLLTPRRGLAGALVAAALLGLAGWITLLSQRAAAAREQLRDSARLQRELFRHSGLLITVKDREGRIVEANEAVAASFGRTVEGMYGRRLDDLLLPQDAARVMAHDSAVMASGRETSFEETVAMPDGEHTFLAIRFPVRNADGAIRGVAAVRADVTEHVQLEQALRLAKAEAEAANLTKSAFLANISHELRTPLNTIIGLSELVAEELAEGGHAELGEPMLRVVDAGRHLLALINDILDLSKIEAGRVELHPEPCRVRDLVDTVVGTVQPLAKAHGNRIDVRFAADPGVVSLDSTRVKQILFNLLSNACKFTRDGHVSVAVDVSGTTHGSRLVVAVADTGIGIAPEQVERIFEPFRQADQTIARRYGGTGLGLSICRQLCGLMGGDIEVASTPGAGSVFTVTLPLVDGQAARAAAPAPAARAPHAGDLIVVADDDPNALLLAVTTLERAGFRVQPARSGAEALAAVREVRPALLVLDILLGDMSGWDVLAALRADAEFRDVPVIVCTITDADQRGVSLGVVEHLTKPFERERLLALARRFAQRVDGPRAIVADDDPDFRYQIARRLRAEGWQVDEARDGVEALAALRHRPAELMLLDLMMPNMDGIAVLETMHADARLRDVPVILVSAAELSPDVVRMLDGRATELMRKSGGDIEAMLVRVRSTLAALGASPTGEGA
ncbi:MAG: response regulator [Mizugakiibacter sp.]|uniref:hybrid sensor histidine kinase/response regulator n=1 Tax=Mizugakiibacter sp. TaxID=1972610 RepID=UPI0031C2914C|nr:response regulator [Xanthomonadaceae bacterium]